MHKKPKGPTYDIREPRWEQKTATAELGEGQTRTMPRTVAFTVRAQLLMRESREQSDENIENAGAIQDLQVL